MLEELLWDWTPPWREFDRGGVGIMLSISVTPRHVRSVSDGQAVRPKYFGRTERQCQQLRSRPDGQEMSGRSSVRKFSHGRNENNVQLRLVQTFSLKFRRVRTDGLFVRTKFRTGVSDETSVRTDFGRRPSGILSGPKTSDRPNNTMIFSVCC